MITVAQGSVNESEEKRQEAIQVIQTEYKVLESLSKHPNIVRYIDMQWDEGQSQAKLYMEYCIGGSLQDLIEKLKG